MIPYKFEMMVPIREKTTPNTKRPRREDLDSSMGNTARFTQNS